MKPLVITSLALLMVVPAWGRLPETLNFRDETPAHVVPTVAEQPENEKEVELGDWDNDGDLDVAIVVGLGAFGSRRNKLYRNDDGVLVEVSGAPVIDGFTSVDLSRNGFLRDFDGDGWLDLIVINDTLGGGMAGVTKYYANIHPGDVFSHFEDQTFRLGGGGGASCGGVSLDVDSNGWDDLYVGNYPGPSQDTLYLNDGDGFFTEVTATQVPVDEDYTTDISSADLNGDGLPDILVSNHFDPNFAYYNDGQGAGEGPGDFAWIGSVQQLGAGNAVMTAMEPGDFDGDGDIDIYYSNRNGVEDVILRNVGNDGGGKAIFQEIVVAGPGASFESRKATVVDLNGDERPEIVVMFGNRRPSILRNTSVGGVISFVDWTPASAFPTGGSHAGWHSAPLDLDGDELPDILLGGNAGEHVFINAASVELTGSALGGQLPPFHNQDPLAVRGSAVPAVGDEYAAAGIPAGDTLAAIVRGCGDFQMEIRDAGGNVVGSSDRGGIGIEEVLQIAVPAGTVSLHVTTTRACGDGDGDGDLDRDDMVLLRACGPGRTSGDCAGFDFDLDGSITQADLRALRGRALSGIVSSPYILEVLSRD